jgi:hypothetical protein
MEKPLDDKIRDRLSNASSINLMIWIFSFLIDHFVKSHWYYVYGLLAFSVVNAAVLVFVFYKAFAKRDQLIRYKRIRSYFIFNCIMAAVLIFLLSLQIFMHNKSI